MVDYEKGRFVDGAFIESPSWYIGDILTRHAAGHGAEELVCAKVLELRRNQKQGMTPEQRPKAARKTACTCGSETA